MIMTARFSFTCCRERREVEMREREAKERERLEKQRVASREAAEQVHQHFEESLSRLAKQKVSLTIV